MAGRMTSLGSAVSPVESETLTASLRVRFVFPDRTGKMATGSLGVTLVGSVATYRNSLYQNRPFEAHIATRFALGCTAAVMRYHIA